MPISVLMLYMGDTMALLERQTGTLRGSRG
jgi:hypothetical protein